MLDGLNCRGGGGGSDYSCHYCLQKTAIAIYVFEKKIHPSMGNV